jgi:predicted DNA-binding transcriptional regulator YafY
VPVLSARGANGGWSLIDGYRTQLTGLNEPELRALFVGAPSAVLADLRLDDANRNALLKLRSAASNAADVARQRIHVDVSGWRDSRDAVPFLPALQDAVFRERRVRIEYTHGPREVDPLGLVAKGHLWYLVAAFEGEPRTYRVSRLAAYWEESKKNFLERLPRVDVVALVPRDLLTRVKTYLRYGAIDRVDDYDETRVRIEAHFDTMEAAEISLRWDGVTLLP